MKGEHLDRVSAVVWEARVVLEHLERCTEERVWWTPNEYPKKCVLEDWKVSFRDLLW